MLQNLQADGRAAVNSTVVAICTLAFSFVILAAMTILWGREVGAIGYWYWGFISLVPLIGIGVLLVTT